MNSVMHVCLIISRFDASVKNMIIQNLGKMTEFGILCFYYLHTKLFEKKVVRKRICSKSKLPEFTIDYFYRYF